MSPSSGNDCDKRTTSPLNAAPAALQGIWMAETKAAAELVVRRLHREYTSKYEKAANCLAKDRDTLLAFYDFPAEHWKHLRTTNPIESTFATVRHRIIRSKDSGVLTPPGK
jgi:putative transposase